MSFPRRPTLVSLSKDLVSRDESISAELKEESHTLPDIILTEVNQVIPSCGSV